MRGNYLLHFRSPSHVNISKGLLEFDDEFYSMYEDNQFRDPREVFNDIYGYKCTLDKAITLVKLAHVSVLSEEVGSIQPKNVSNNRLSRVRSTVDTDTLQPPQTIP